jgi:hypothetical protein
MSTADCQFLAYDEFTTEITEGTETILLCVLCGEKSTMSTADGYRTYGKTIEIGACRGG